MTMTLLSHTLVRGLLVLSATATFTATLTVAAASGVQAAAPAPVAKAGQPAPASSGNNQPNTRNASIPAKGLFNGDQLSESTKRQLTDLMMQAIGSRIELALLVPTGPWQIDGAGQGDTNLNTARLQSLRRFLTDRGVDPNKVVVESRIDEKIKTPRLDVQLITTPAND
jgi:OOP family OmpA-OmpF porin